jgi:hypothetical protein
MVEARYGANGLRAADFVLPQVLVAPIRRPVQLRQAACEANWDSSDAEVTMAIHDEAIPKAPYEAVEEKLVELLQPGADETSPVDPQAPAAIRPSAVASGDSGHIASWQLPSEPGNSGDRAPPVVGRLTLVGEITERRVLAQRQAILDFSCEATPTQ